ncbi:hypothetical protein F0562_006147 [Nyssa sinensis]|uniref:BHLH domain-containing protein n=1 Tax=Nyssa sinensis TaxID=561372 RepID=A0A5J5ALA4_9ASTE|nr:hypothetical protein F0562_006147 [Nyssa sinensis]
MNSPQYKSFDDFTTQQLETAPGGQNLQGSLSSESYTSYPTFNPKTTINTTFSGSFIETCQTNSERPTKQLKTNSWNSSTTKHVTAKTSSSTQLLSFANFGPSPTNPQPSGRYQDCTMKPKDEAVSPRDMRFPSLNSKDSYHNTNSALKTGQGTMRARTMMRTPSNAQDHIMAERKRREKLSQRFIALSAIVPGLKKMDKASVLGDATKYLKQLQERVKLLEEQTKKKSEESVVFVKKCQLYADNNSSSSCDENFNGRSNEALPEIEARVSEKNVLIRIHCEQHKGFLLKILSEIEKIHLRVVNTSALPFGKYAMDITIVAQDQSVIEVVKN